MKLDALRAAGLLLILLLASFPPLASAQGGRIDDAEIVIGQTPDGRDITIRSTFLDDGQERPAILLVGGYGVQGEYTSKLLRELSAKLTVPGDESGILERVKLYVLEDPDPASSGLNSVPQRETAYNETPMDDDRDGATDEDGPEDM